MQLSICAIFKNEAPYLREWVEFHRLVGVESIYLYQNRSEDDYQSALHPFLNDGFVHLIDWPYVPPAQKQTVKNKRRPKANVSSSRSAA